jgi:hypothetical protein
MDIEGRIRSRIEAILLNDARNDAEMKLAAIEEGPLENDPFGEERNLYQRIIGSYRSAVSEVNSLLEENISCLSGFYQIVDNIKEKDNFQEISLQIVDCILQDLGAEYCSLVLRAQEGQEGGFCYIEGIREQRKFICSHDHATLLGSPEFDRVISGLVAEAKECLNIGDVYRESRFNLVDFPSVVRSMVFLPIRVRQVPKGALILSNSMPRFFTQNHTRVLQILATMIAHLWLLTAGRGSSAVAPGQSSPRHAASEDDQDVVSVVLINFTTNDYNRRFLGDRETIRSIRTHLSSTLKGKELIQLYDETELLALLPGTTSGQMFMRLQELSAAFESWKGGQGERAKAIRLNLGFSTCESGEDLARTLEVASLMMHADQEENDHRPLVVGFPSR